MYEMLEEEYRRKVEMMKRWLNKKLGEDYPAKIYMHDPFQVSDADLVSQICARPKLFCVIDKNHTSDDAIPLERILRGVEIELIGGEDLEGLEKVYEGSFSIPPKICLWSLLKEEGIAPRTTGEYGKMGLRTSPHAIEVVLKKVSRKVMEKPWVFEELMKKYSGQMSLEEYISP